MQEFIFNGISSKVHNLIIKNPLNHFSIPSKSYESIKVPGRTGNLIIDDGSKENTEITVDCYIDFRKVSNRKTAIKNLGIWLTDHVGYKNLTFEDGITYNAIVSGKIDIKKLTNDIYELSIKFECMEVL